MKQRSKSSEILIRKTLYKDIVAFIVSINRRTSLLWILNTRIVIRQKNGKKCMRVCRLSVCLVEHIWGNFYLGIDLTVFKLHLLSLWLKFRGALLISALLHLSGDIVKLNAFSGFYRKNSTVRFFPLSIFGLKSDSHDCIQNRLPAEL